MEETRKNITLTVLTASEGMMLRPANGEKYYTKTVVLGKNARKEDFIEVSEEEAQEQIPEEEGKERKTQDDVAVVQNDYLT